MSVPAALADGRLRRHRGHRAGRIARRRPGRRAAPVPARPPRSGARAPVSQPVPRAPSRSAAPRPTWRRRSIGSWRRSPTGSASRSTAITMSTASPPRSSCAARSRALGADVVHFIPERLKDGYGLQPAAIERLHGDGVSLVVSVDCGIRGAEAARRARGPGRRLDHHRSSRAGRRVAAGAGGDQSEAPRLRYPGQVSGRCRRGVEAGPGAAAAEPIAQAWLPGFIKVAAIGTLADVVPLVGENRVIAKLGLDLLSRGPHKVGPAIAARRLRAYQARPSTAITSRFLLAPRVNAAGRMSTPDIATRLLLASDEATGRGGPPAGDARSTAKTSVGRKRKPRSGRREEDRSTADPDVGARIGPRRGRRGLASRRDRHRRLEARSTRSTARRSCCRSKTVSRAARAAAFSTFDMLGALERCARPVHPIRRPHVRRQGWRSGLADQRVAPARSTTSPTRTRRSRRPDAAAAHRLRPHLQGDHRRRRRRRRLAGAFRRRQSAARCSPRAACRDHRRAAKAGSGTQDGAQAGRTDLSRDRLARGRAPRLRGRAPGRPRRGLSLEQNQHAMARRTSS